MGWSSWNAFGTDIDEDEILDPLERWSTAGWRARAIVTSTSMTAGGCSGARATVNSSFVPRAFHPPSAKAVSHLSVRSPRSHLSMWAMINAPLLIGMDLRQAPPALLDVFGNEDVIAINQDPGGHQAVVAFDSDEVQIFVKTLSTGDKAVAVFNRSGAGAGLRRTARRMVKPSGSAARDSRQASASWQIRGWKCAIKAIGVSRPPLASTTPRETIAMPSPSSCTATARCSPPADRSNGARVGSGSALTYQA
jgi:hypothetical protein